MQHPEFLIFQLVRFILRRQIKNYDFSEKLRIFSLLDMKNGEKSKIYKIKSYKNLICKIFKTFIFYLGYRILKRELFHMKFNYFFFQNL